MESHFYHLQLNVNYAENSAFYKELFTLLGWEVISETDDMIGLRSGKNGDIWFIDNQEDAADYDKRGMNHLAIRVGQEKDVDTINDFLALKEVTALFGTPKHRPEFANDSETYYQVMFETPDRILMEIVYIGPKTA